MYIYIINPAYNSENGKKRVTPLNPLAFYNHDITAHAQLTDNTLFHSADIKSAPRKKIMESLSEILGNNRQYGMGLGIQLRYGDIKKLGMFLIAKDPMSFSAKKILSVLSKATSPKVQIELLQNQAQPSVMQTQYPIPPKIQTQAAQFPAMPLVPYQAPSVPYQAPSVPYQPPSIPYQAPSVPYQVPAVSMNQMPIPPQPKYQQPMPHYPIPQQPTYQQPTYQQTIYPMPMSRSAQSHPTTYTQTTSTAARYPSSQPNNNTTQSPNQRNFQKEKLLLEETIKSGVVFKAIMMDGLTWEINPTSNIARLVKFNGKLDNAKSNLLTKIIDSQTLDDKQKENYCEIFFNSGDLIEFSLDLLDFLKLYNKAEDFHLNTISLLLKRNSDEPEPSKNLDLGNNTINEVLNDCYEYIVNACKKETLSKVLQSLLQIKKNSSETEINNIRKSIVELMYNGEEAPNGVLTAIEYFIIGLQGADTRDLLKNIFGDSVGNHDYQIRDFYITFLSQKTSELLEAKSTAEPKRKRDRELTDKSEDTTTYFGDFAAPLLLSKPKKPKLDVTEHVYVDLTEEAEQEEEKKPLVPSEIASNEKTYESDEESDDNSDNEFSRFVKSLRK